MKKFIRYSVNSRPVYGLLEGDTISELDGDLFQNKTTGQVSIWEMNGNSLIGGGPVTPNPGLAWKAIGGAVTTAWNGILSWFESLPGKIFGFFSALPGEFLQLGSDIIHAGVYRGLGEIAGCFRGSPNSERQTSAVQAAPARTREPRLSRGQV